jgi:hypothetical protein
LFGLKTNHLATLVFLNDCQQETKSHAFAVSFEKKILGQEMVEMFD